MPSPFPGMDPFIESQKWEGFHTRFITGICDTLVSKVRPRYDVDIEQRVYLERRGLHESARSFVADVGVIDMERHGAGVWPEEHREAYLVIRRPHAQEVVTVIEVLSLANKLTHEGREAYEDKRKIVLGGKTNLVEIDLLRAGQPLPPFQAGQSDYRILLSPAPTRPRAMAYTLSVRDPLPTIPIPLRPGDPEPTLPLNQLLHDLYDRASYDLAIDYSQPPVPPLYDDDAAWARQLLSAG